MAEATQIALMARIEELESRVAFQEQTLDAMNSAFYQLQQDQQQLATQFEWLAQKSRELAERVPDAVMPVEAPPPHY